MVYLFIFFSGGSQLSQKGQILEVGNSDVFGIWQSGSVCDSLSGTREPSSLPPVENLQNFDMLMGIMCRSIKMEFQKDVHYGNVKAKRFVMSPKTFDKKAQCLKITQNVAFEFLYFGIFHQFLTY